VEGGNVQHHVKMEGISREGEYPEEYVRGKCPDPDLDTAALSSVVTRSPLLRVPFLCVTRGCVSLTAEAQGRPGQMPPSFGGQATLFDTHFVHAYA